MLSPQEVQEFRKKYDITPVGESEKPGYLSRVGSSMKKEAFGIGESIVRGSELIDQGIKNKSVKDVVTGVGRAGLGSAGGAIRTAFTPLTEAVAPVIAPAVQKLASFVGEENIEKVQKWAESHPDAAANLKDVFDIGTPVIGAKGVKSGITKTGTVAKHATKAVKKEADSLVMQVGKATEKQPAKIMQRVARISKGKQAKFEAQAGESIGEYLTKRDIFGDVDNVSAKLYSRFTKSKETADKALDSLTGTYEPTPVKTALKELLAREARVSAEGAPSPIMARVNELINKFDKKGLTMSEINEAKRLFEKNIKMDFLKQNLPEGVAKATNIDNAIRRWQFKQAEILGLKNLPAINKETRLAKQLLDDLGVEYAGSAGNNAMTLTDWIMLSGGDPTAIAGFLTKKTLSSKKFQSAIAERLNKGKPVLKDVKAEMGESQVKQLPAPKAGSIPSQNFVPMKMLPPYSAGKQVKNATRNKPQPARKSPKK